MNIVQTKFELLATLKNKKLLVFDFDGVLADSVRVKTEAYGAMYEPYGKDIAEKVVEYHVQNGGVSRFEKFKLWEKVFFNREVTPERLSELCSEFAERVVERVVEAPAIPGAEAFLIQQKARGLIMTVNSATPTNEIKEIVLRRGMAKYFDVVMGSPESKADNLIQSMQLFDYEANDVVFFGDAEADFLAAKTHNVSFIGVGSEIKSVMAEYPGKHFAIDDFSILVQESN